jgi:hypothetical protein
VPFAGFKDFDSCVRAQMAKGKNRSSALSICGYLQAAAEHKKSAKKDEKTSTKTKTKKG